MIKNRDEAFSLFTMPLPRDMYSIVPTKNPEIHFSENGDCSIWLWAIFGFGSICINFIFGFIKKKKTKKPLEPDSITTYDYDYEY